MSQGVERERLARVSGLRFNADYAGKGRHRYSGVYGPDILFDRSLRRAHGWSIEQAGRADLYEAARSC